MKKLIALFSILVCIFALVSCNNNAAKTSETESVTDYGKVIEHAKTEFLVIFAEFENLKIDETSVLTRTDDAEQIVVQIKYSSKDGSGVYGFEYKIDDYVNLELIRHGEDITFESLLE